MSYDKIDNVKFVQKDKRKPVQFFISDEQSASSSWSYLSWISFIKTLDYSYNIIRINLDRHHTIGGVIADLFSRAAILDPQWEIRSDVTLSNLNNENAFQNLIITDVFKILKRNRCILVFDMLESFCRPLMVHHGLASQPQAALTEVKRLKEFFFKIAERDIKDFCDSYVIITIGEPFFRYHTDRTRKEGGSPHPGTGDNKLNLYKELTSLPKEFFKKAEGNDSCKVNLQHLDANAIIYSTHFFTSIKNKDSVTSEIDSHWKNPDQSSADDFGMKRSKDRANDVISLLSRLRTKNESLERKNTLHALIALLSLFRRTRTTPLLHGMLTRWAFRPIHNVTIDAETAKERRQTFDETLRKLMTDELPPVGPVSQDHEGGNIWLFRTVNTRVYEALTENLRSSSWIQKNEDEQFHAKKNEISCLAVDAALCISWHLFAARAYYVEVFMPSQDINIFWEYLYHRVSAIRTIALLVFVLKQQHDDIGDELKEYCADLDFQTTCQGGGPSDQGTINNFIKYITLIGLFDPLTPADGQSEINKSVFIEKLIKLQITSLKSLLSALKKNSLLFRSTTASDSILACANQFLEKELEKMQLTPKDEEIDEEVKKTIEELKAEFIVLQYQALHAQQAYDKVLEIHYENINEDKIKDTDIGSIDSSEVIRGFLNKVSKINQNNFLTTIQSLSFISQARVEQHTATSETPEKDRKDIEKLTRTLVTITEASEEHLPEKIRNWVTSRKLAAHNLHCRFLLESNFPMWEYSPDKTETELNLLRDIEKKNITFERLIREETETPRADALHRSNAFMMRARVYYLQNDFAPAHHYLDLAMVGLHQDYIEHRTQLSRIHIFRAELLYYSSCCNRDNNTGEVNQKIKKATQALKDAKNFSNGINHSNKQKQLLTDGEDALSRLKKILES